MIRKHPRARRSALPLSVPSRREAAALLATTLLAATGCGGNAERAIESLDGFQIQEELENARYTYDFGETTIEIEYFQSSDDILGISRPRTAGVTVGWFAQPTTSTTFRITGAAIDTDADGDFFDEQRLSVSADSRGEFFNDGDVLEVVLTVGEADVELSERGDLISTQTI